MGAKLDAAAHVSKGKHPVQPPSTHQSDPVSLPDVSVRLMRAHGEVISERIPLAEALHEWSERRDSNLLVVMGPFGTGKTTGLIAYSATRDAQVVYLNFDEISSAFHTTGTMRALPAAETVIFDNFDAINTLSGTQVEPPDLRAISHLTSANRIILATRRSPFHRDDELLGQLQSEERLSQLGFRQPTVVQLLPWEIHELRRHAERLTPPQDSLTTVVDYLASLDPQDSEGLRTPLLVKMLMRLAPKLQGLNERPTLARIYQAYSSVALAADYDLRRSQIPSAVKAEVLADLAYDIFSGVTQSELMTGSAMALTVERVSERLLESLMRLPAFRQRRGFDTYGWTEDFLSTNHMFERTQPARLAEFSEPQYGFVHQSFYEYFVSVALCRAIGSGRTFGLDIARLSMATVDSLAFAFAKELGGTQLRSATREIVKRPRITVADRLILLYFLEDEEDFASILGDAPHEYRDELQRLEFSVSSFFLKKMIRYQLVIAGLYDPSHYIAEVRQYEDEGGRNAEARLHGAEKGVTQQLLARLRNPSLERARLITIYRLGQLGDLSAIEPLQWISTAADAGIADAARKAVVEIQSRLGVI